MGRIFIIETFLDARQNNESGRGLFYKIDACQLCMVQSKNVPAVCVYFRTSKPLLPDISVQSVLPTV